MKKPIALILAAALMALPVSPVIALADTTGETTIVSATEVNPGTLPDSPLYWLDELVEKLQVALTFDSQKKIKLLEKHANERMAEILALAEKVNSEEANSVATETKVLEESEGQEKSVESTNEQQESKESTKTTTGSAITNPKLEKKLKGCEKALTRYNEKIAQAQELLEQLENPNSEEYKNLQAALAKVNANNVIVLGNLLEKLPPQASQRLALNIVRSMEKAVDKMEKMESKNQKTVESTTAHSEANQEEKNVDAITKPVAVKKTTPAVTVSDTSVQENTKVSDELTKEEYKALSKEAKEALKQFQEELGLKGPEKEHDKDKSKDYERDHERKELNKETAKSYSNKSGSRYYQNDQNDRNDRDRDDDQGNDKGSRNLR